MNWQHFRTLVWLRRRLFQNRMRKAGRLNAIITQVLMAFGLLGSVAFFFTALGLGIWLLPKASPDVVLYVWTGVIAGFLFFWMLGVMTELQRSEVLSIEKLFHFPISPSSAFLINYLSSLVTLSLILFVPAMIGLGIASVVALGPSMLIVLPLVIGFVLMVTAVTYQFRGWLATLMVNKRRRRTIMACITGAFILISQSGNLVNLVFQGKHRHEVDAVSQQYQHDLEQLQAEFNSKKIDGHEYDERLQSLADERQRAKAQQDEDELRQVKRWVAIGDLALPPGWLAYGAYQAAQSRVWPGLIGIVLFCALAGVSLRRSYHTTVRFYLGDYRADRSTAEVPRAPVSVAAAPTPAAAIGARPAPSAPGQAPSLAGLVGRSVPWVPEQAAATGLATLRSLMRAPEVKMMLLTPIILGVVIITARLSNKGDTFPRIFRPMIALGIVSTVVVSLSQLFQNQFGFDRGAFRAFVLSPAPRWQILLGKNLALAPVVAVSGAIFLGILEYVLPLGPTDFLATFVELASAYMIVCLVGNQMSILLPSAVRQGSMRSSSDTKTLRVLARFAAMLGQVVAFVPLLIPLGVDYLVQQFPWGAWIPTYLILSLLLALVIVLVYRIVLDYQGGLLQRRELQILEAVTTKDD